MPAASKTLLVRVVAATLMMAVGLTTVGAAALTVWAPPAGAQPPPGPQFPESTEPEPGDPEIDIVFEKFPDGFGFEYGGAHFGVWQTNCALVTELENETDEWVAWQSFLEADPNYHCGDLYRSQGSDAAGQLTGIDGYGRNGFAADVYECSVDEGAWNHMDRKIFAALCSSIFGLNKMAVSWTIAVVEWAFRFEVGNAMAGYTSTIGAGYFNSLGAGNDNSAYWAALAFTTFYAATKVLRGQMSKGAGELGFSVVLLMAFWALVIYGSGFAGVTRGVLDASADVSSEVGRITLDPAAFGNCPQPIDPGSIPSIPGADGWIGSVIGAHNDKYGGTGGLVCPMANGIFIALIERPYDLINWGADLEQSGCSTPRNAVLASGPWGNDDWPRHIMADSGCKEAADFNHDPTDSRVGIAFSSLIVTLLTLILIVAIAMVLLAAQIVLVLLVSVMPFAMISAALPGTGRDLFFKWLTAIIKVGVLTVAMTAIIAVHLSTLNVGMEATKNSPWAVQAGVMILVTVLMFALMRKAVKASGTASARVTSAIGRAVTPRGSDGAYGQLGWGARFGDRVTGVGANLGRGAAIGTGVAVGLGAATMIAGPGAVATMTKTGARTAAHTAVSSRASAAAARRAFNTARL